MRFPDAIVIYDDNVSSSFSAVVAKDKEANSSTPHFDQSRVDIVPIGANDNVNQGPKLESSSCGNLSVPEGVPIADLLRVRLHQNRTELFTSTVFAIEGEHNGLDWKKHSEFIAF